MVLCDMNVNPFLYVADSLSSILSCKRHIVLLSNDICLAEQDEANTTCTVFFGQIVNRIR